VVQVGASWDPSPACAAERAHRGIAGLKAWGPGVGGARKTECKAFDFPAFLDATAEPEDFVIVKMDCEGMEWAIFDALEKQGLHRKIDEIFVEFHFDREYDKHPPGPRTKYKGADNWAPAARRSYPGGRVFYKDDAVTYFEHWRKLVPAFHLWA